MIREYAIYQCPVSVNYCFRSFDEAKDKWDIFDYVHVYRGTVESETINEALEKLFYIFNVDRPSDFYGRSLSVSDVVRLSDENERNNYYYCDSFGWSECPKEGR